MPFAIREAVRGNIHLKALLASESGGGKTFSALALATGLSEGAKPVLIDSDAEKSNFDATPGPFHFDQIDLGPPFTPERYLEAFQLAEAAPNPVMIVDTMSDAWESPGGMLQMRDEQRNASGQKIKGPGGWNKPKERWMKLVTHIRQCRKHVIFTARADYKIEMKGKQVRDLGWTPVVEKRFVGENLVFLTMTADAPGMVNYQLPHRLPDVFAPIFEDRKILSVETGKALAGWCRGESPGIDLELWTKARNVSQEGSKALKAWGKDLEVDQRSRLMPIRHELARNAKAADEAEYNKAF